MQKSDILFVIFFIALIDGKAQVVGTDKLIVDRKLSWQDFTGPVDPESKYAAKTHWRVNYKYTVILVRGDTVQLDLQVATLLKSNSWAVPSKQTDELLEHEQGHFNIAQLCALRFKKAVKNMILFKHNYAQTIDSLFNGAIAEANQQDIQYDEETNHHLNKRQQKKWNTKINEMLLNP
ncbi:DUF922 domain-containing protein [Spirosoma jeollabukense]